MLIKLQDLDYGGGSPGNNAQTEVTISGLTSDNTWTTLCVKNINSYASTGQYFDANISDTSEYSKIKVALTNYGYDNTWRCLSQMRIYGY